MKSLEFKSILADISIFTHPRGIIITLYIDDMLILVKDLKEIKQVKNNIKKAHIMKDLKAISKILEIYMTHKTDKFIKIN